MLLGNPLLMRMGTVASDPLVMLLAPQVGDTQVLDKSSYSHTISSAGIGGTLTTEVADPWGGSRPVLKFTGDTPGGYHTSDSLLLPADTGDWTIEVWARSQVNTTPGILFLSMEDTCQIYANTNNTHIVTQAYNGSGWIIPAAHINSYTGTSWAHMAVVRTGSMVKHYDNGALDDTFTGIPALPLSGYSSFYVGVSIDLVSNPYKGYVGALRVTRTALTPSEFMYAAPPL